MKNIIEKLISVLTVVVAALAVFLIGFFYLHTVSDRIYLDSTNQLKETYDIVRRSTRTYIEQKWRILADWKKSVSESDFDFATRKDEWRFENFYFVGAPETAPADTDPERKVMACASLRIGKDGDGKTSIEGIERSGEFLFDETWRELTENKTNILVGEEQQRYGNAQKTTVFAVPISDADPHEVTLSDGTVFEYAAIALSFSNDDIAYALDTNPYNGEAECYVIHGDGRLLFSLERGGDIFTDFFAFFTGFREADSVTLDGIREAMGSGESNSLVRCDIKGQSYCLFWQKLGYSDYYMISAVPQSTISSGFLAVQQEMTKVFIIICTIIVVAIVFLLVLRIYRQSKRSAMELKYREQMFDVLSSSVDDIFIMLDRETQKIDYLSPNIERLLGISHREACENIRNVAKCAVDYNIIVPKAELDEIPQGGSKFWECEYMHQTTGERRWYRVTIYRNKIRDVEKFIIVMSDRTVEQQMNQNLQEAFEAAKNANNAKSNFLSNMSHDIRTPMNAIVGFSVLLEKDANDPDKVREYTRKITTSGHHLLSIINDVLDMSKIENGKTQLDISSFSLPELIEEINTIVMPQAKAKMQDYTVRVTGNPPELIMGDRLRLNRILMNILSNAVKYTPENGRIEFNVINISDPGRQFAKLRFVVRDNGIGMSEDYLKTIFDPFSREVNSVTNKVQGTGLGMAITKSLVDLMGGVISVESEPGKGSTFTVELSFSLAEREEPDAWYKHKISRMLVADDERDVCLAVKETMSETEVDVECVFSGAEAVEAAEKAHAEKRDFDVILLDWKMPEMSGVEAARLIRERTKRDIPILVLTSYDWADIEEEARAAGIDAFMSKPFFVSTFWETIREFFEKQSGETAAESQGTGESVLSGRMFLLAEDNELNAEILTEMLAMENAKSELAVNGAQAVEMFLAAPVDYYDMILMDVQMPVMNGYEATRRIRSSSHPRAATVPIVAMTANAFAEDVRNALDSGMNGHLAKPIDMAKVKELIGRILGTKNEPEKADGKPAGEGGSGAPVSAENDSPKNAENAPKSADIIDDRGGADSEEPPRKAADEGSGSAPKDDKNGDGSDVGNGKK